MDAFEAVRTLLAVRRYRDEPVPEATLQRILEAAHLTASSKNEQPWHFIVIQDRDTLRTLGEMIPYGRYIAEAPLAIAVALDTSPFAISDASRAVQSMALTAWADGVGSNWVGFIGGLDTVKPLLNIPETVGLLAIIPFGYPAETVGKGKKRRKPLAQIAHRERFGQPYEAR